MFDWNLVGQVLEDHHLPKRLAQFMPEDRISEITDTNGRGVRPAPARPGPGRSTADTMLRLAQLGNPPPSLAAAPTSLPASSTTSSTVRLVGSLESRVAYIQRL